MHRVSVFGVLVVVVASAALGPACASSNGGSSCQIEGAYAFSSTVESGNCPAGNGGTTTITKASNGDGYLIEATGGQGACAAKEISACKLQAKCDIVVTDATDPTNNLATVQDSWTFDSAGFKGTVTLFLPPAASQPNGCQGTVRATGARR